MKLPLKYDLCSYWVAVIALAFFLVACVAFTFLLVEQQLAETSIWLITLSLLLGFACLYFMKRSLRKLSVHLQRGGGHLVLAAGTEDGTIERPGIHKDLDAPVFDLRGQFMDFASRLQAVREEERASIAREIHDELGQKITRLKIGLSLTRDSLKRRRSPKGLSREVGELDHTLALADGLAQDVRRIAAVLRPDELKELDLADAIRKSVDQYVMQGQLRCRFNPGRRIVGLNRQKSIALFRIFQEAMTNVLRHSGATTVDISLTKYRGRVRLEITDNGRGIGADNSGKEKGLGILGMRERATRVGGTFSITRAKLGGTAVGVEVSA